MKYGPTTTDRLIAFLRARYSDLIDAPRLVAEVQDRNYPPWKYKVTYGWARFAEPRAAGIARQGFTLPPGAPSPQEVVAWVEANRAVVDGCEHTLRYADDLGAVLLAEDVLRRLAVPFAGHEHYKPEWEPRD